MKWNVIIVVAAILLIAYKQFTLSGYRQITGKEVDKWKTTLEKSSFKGEVIKIETKENKSKHVQYIHLTILDTLNINVSAYCEYFKIENKNIIIAAHNLNITTGPKHRINRGDILKKVSTSENIYVYSKMGCYKYYFPLFDGLGTKDSVLMNLASDCNCDQ